jgi:phospholipid-binding lipoprotein MlaA
MQRKMLVGGALAFSLVAGLAHAEGAPASSDKAPPTAAPAATPDPWEHPNRHLYRFNQGLDRGLIAPVVHVYMRVTPGQLRNGISNALDNLDQPRVVANDLLQGHPAMAGRATGGFVINSTVGLLGLFDVAGRWGIERHTSDFGQTLGRYGVGPGPYIFAPVAGPSDLRDGFGRLVDAVADPASLVLGGVTSTFGATRLGAIVVETRAEVDGALKGLDRDTIDPYAALRSAYLQQRTAVVQGSRGEEVDLPDIDAPPAGGPSQ